jgi:hypothetical protein
MDLMGGKNHFLTKTLPMVVVGYTFATKKENSAEVMNTSMSYAKGTGPMAPLQLPEAEILQLKKVLDENAARISPDVKFNKTEKGWPKYSYLMPFYPKQVRE